MRRAALVVVLVALAAVPALAEQVPSEARVANRGPAVTAFAFENADDDPGVPGVQVLPTPGENRTLDLRIEVVDDNGYPDVARVNVTLRGSDNLTLIQGPTPTVWSEGRGRTATYAGAFVVPPWLPPGTYHASTDAFDKRGATANAYLTFEVLESLAMAVGSTGVAFGDGAFAPGETTAPTAVSVSNVGNLAIDLEVSATDLVSSEATIPASRIHVGLDQNMTSSWSLDEPHLLGSFDLEAGENSERDVWFNLHVPSGDEQYVPEATYRGTIVLSAVVSE